MDDLRGFLSTCVSDIFYDEAFKHFPILRERPDYQKFFWYLCLSGDYDRNFDKQLLCRHTIARLLGQDAANFVAQDFFEAFARDVVGQENFLWHKHFKKRCRMVARLNLGAFDEILNKELARAFDGRPPVYLDGTKHNGANARKARNCLLPLTLPSATIQLRFALRCVFS
jgi:hypothetical protein